LIEKTLFVIRLPTFSIAFSAISLGDIFPSFHGWAGASRSSAPEFGQQSRRILPPATPRLAKAWRERARHSGDELPPYEQVCWGQRRLG
jgi:hypothetical protein